MTTVEGNVPCDGCKACCRNFSMVMLEAEWGDDHTKYKTQQLPDGRHILKFKINGDCIYLGADGCEIHDDRPAVCRKFDCRVEFLSTTPMHRAYEVASGYFSKAVFDAGEKRAHTLKRPHSMEGVPREFRYQFMEMLSNAANRHRRKK